MLIIPKFTSPIENELDKTLSKTIMNELNYFFNKFKKTLKTDVIYKTFKKENIKI